MRSTLFKYIYFFILLSIAQVVYAHSSEHKPRQISFVENKGQWGERPLFRTQFHGGYAYFEEGRITYVVKDMEDLSEFLGFKMKPGEYKKNNNPDPEIDHHAYRVYFKGANKNAAVIPEDKTKDYNNYYLGNDRSKWASRVQKYRKITYRELYNGIDLQFNEHHGFLKYTFEVGQTADAEQIKMQYEAVRKIKLKDNRLVIKNSVHDIVEMEPYAYQLIEGDTVDVACNFSVNENVVSYNLPNGYDRSRKLFIDPTLVFSTYSGATSDNWGYTATYDSEGYAYGGGTVFGSGYPTTTGAYSENYSSGSCDMVITKFDSTGSNLLYSTFLGGSGADVPHSLICNSFDELIVLGTTGSTDFPITASSFDANFAGGTPYILTSVINYTSGSDITLTKLSQDGTQLQNSTYVGGSGNDGLNASSVLRYNYADEVRGEVMVDENDDIYVASSTNSMDFPVTGNALQQSNHGGQEGVVFKMSASLKDMLWSTYLGGSDDDAAYNISVVEQAGVYIGGGTNSNDFPVTFGAHQSSFQGGSADGFVTKITNDGSQLQASTYYGSDKYDQVYFVDTDLKGNVYALGQTGASGNTFIYNAPWNQPGGGQFVSQLTKGLDDWVFSTAFGNASNLEPDISPTSFMVDYCGSIYIAGWGGGLNNFGGTSGLPVTSNAFQTTTDNNDYYFMVLEQDAQDLQYASFFGGTKNSGEHVDGGTSRFSKKGAIYQAICSGCGGYSDMPTSANAWSTTNNSSNCNLAVVKFDFDVKAVIADFKRPYSGCAPYTIQTENRSFSSGTNTYYLWDFGDGDTSMAYQPSHTYTQKGTYEITLTVVDSTSCNISDSTKFQILVLGDDVDTLPDVDVCKGDSVQIGISPYSDPSLTYEWSPTVWQGSTNFMPTGNIHKSQTKVLPRNDTTFYLTIDNQLCKDTLVQYVNVIDIKADAGPDRVVCDSVVSIQGQGNGANIQYIWSDTASFTDTLNKDITNGTFVYDMDQTGNLFLKVTDGKCSDIDTMNVDFLINIEDSLSHPTCHGDCNGRISVNASGGKAPYSYHWSNGQTGKVIDNLCAGDYSVKVYDDDSCLAIKNFKISEPAEIKNDFQVTNAPCEEVCIGKINTNTSGGVKPYDYQWSNGGSSATESQLCVGNYQLTVTDNRGCQQIDTVEVENTSEGIDFTAWTDKDTIYQGESTTIHVNDTLNYSYSWNPGASLENPSAPSTKAYPMETTTYVVTITDQYGCVFKDSVTIYVKEVNCGEPFIFVPNAFSPDGDGKNDVLYVRTQVAEDIYFAVYNRWGEKVFETKDKNKGWDGTINGKKAEQGVYVYKLQVFCFTDEIFEKSGNVTLIR